MSLTFKLDDVPQPSLSVVELNTLLTSMRKAVKAGKILVIRDLVQYLRRLSRKLSRDQSQCRLKQKLAHRESELKLLRELSIIRLCKLLLANERTKDELGAIGHQLTAQDRLVARLAAIKPVQDFVERFRREHPDWRSLTHYILYKNVSGKWKTREQKKRNRKVRGSLPLPPAPTELMIQDSAGDTVDTSAADSELYRVPLTETKSTEPLPPSGTVHPPLPSYPSAGMDSDSASDIADDIVDQILRKRQKSNALVPDITPPPKDGQVIGKKNRIQRTNTVLKQDSNTDSENANRTKVRFAVDTQVNSRKDSQKPTEVDDSGSEQSSEPNKLFMENSDDENPLGTDDLEVKRKLASRAARTSRGRSSCGKRGLVRLRGKPFPKHPAQNITGVPGPHVHRTEFANENIHPSWQAKREQKLKTKLSSALSTASTKKHIVFDD